MKTCSRCNREKSLDQFYTDLHNRSGLQSYCKACKALRGRELRKVDVVKTKTQDRKAKLRKYDLAPDEFDKMLSAQNGRCAVCRRTIEEEKQLQIDHNHTTNKVRGLLCGKCNRGLGLFGEDLNLLSKAVEYLLHWKELHSEAKTNPPINSTGEATQ
jgi:hypothetical protein